MSDCVVLGLFGFPSDESKWGLVKSASGRGSRGKVPARNGKESLLIKGNPSLSRSPSLTVCAWCFTGLSFGET